MTSSTQLDRRAVLKGLAGVTLALPLLEAMGKEVAVKTPRRFCAMYTANGMSLPNPKHRIDEWSWFPKTEGRAFEFGKSTEPLRPFRCCGRSPDRATLLDRRSPRATLIHLAVRFAS